MGNTSDNDRLAELRNNISDLVQRYAEIAFAVKAFVPGQTPVHARLADGPVVDFNIMIRRDKHRAHVEELSICDSASIDLPWDTVAIFLREGCLHLSSPPHNYTAGPLDTLIFEKGHIERVEISGSADFILIGFDRLEHPGAWKLEETQDLRMLKKLILS